MAWHSKQKHCCTRRQVWKVTACLLARLFHRPARLRLVHTSPCEMLRVDLAIAAVATQAGVFMLTDISESIVGSSDLRGHKANAESVPHSDFTWRAFGVKIDSNPHFSGTTHTLSALGGDWAPASLVGSVSFTAAELHRNSRFCALGHGRGGKWVENLKGQQFSGEPDHWNGVVGIRHKHGPACRQHMGT